MKSRNRILELVIRGEAVLFLVPSTLLFIAGFIFSIIAFFAANKGTLTPAFLAISAALLLPGYGLYSLWWLVAKFNKVPVHEVPRYIWGGVITGSLVALLFTMPFVLSWLSPSERMISVAKNATMVLLIGGGPLVVTLTLLAIMRPWRPANG